VVKITGHPARCRVSLRPRKYRLHNCIEGTTMRSRISRRAALLLAMGVAVRTIPFAAAAEKQTPLWTFGWITDTQAREHEWVAALCDHLKADKPKMVVHTGDTNFGHANTDIWKAVLGLLRDQQPPPEFHVAWGNHDRGNNGIKAPLLRAASQGIYPIAIPDGRVDHVMGPQWPIWNPEVAVNPHWQFNGHQPHRYVFKRGGIRFIVCDCYCTDEQTEWVRNLIVQPDDSSVTLILQHECNVDQLARYVEGLEGKHNVKLVMSGHGHTYTHEERHGVTFIQSEGMFFGHFKESDAMTFRVYRDRLQLDRYVLPPGEPMARITGPTTIWTCPGAFSEYRRPPMPTTRPAPAVETRVFTRPNIIVMVADDLGYADLSCYGAKGIRTPNVDRLAAEGVRCTQFYVSTPVCAPTRVSLMTGRYPARTSLNTNPNWKDPNSGLDPSEVTVAEVLEKAGYSTGVVGKWHLGYDKRFWPLQQGFDEYFGFISGWADYYKHFYQTEGAVWMVRGNERRDEPGYMTDLFVREAGSFIERHARGGSPFFLYLPFNAPHNPIEPPPGCDKKQHDEVYRAMVEYLDAGVGKLLDTVQKTGIADNTLVIFMSDNGAEANDGSNGPLRGLKRSVYEGGIRVPFIARHPGCLPAGSSSDKLAVSMDLFTTLADLAEAELPENVVIDGKDILGSLAGEAGSPHEKTPLFWAFGNQDAVRAGNWKLVRENGKPVGLYNIRDDESEKKDQSAKNLKRVEDLGRLIEEWRKTMRNPAASG
jgi:arylsulfatase A